MSLQKYSFNPVTLIRASFATESEQDHSDIADMMQNYSDYRKTKVLLNAQEV